MSDASQPHLERGLNTLHATSLNVANMLGAGPFITIPVFLATMHGPQAMIGWVIAMILVMCDGLIWAELGAAFPGSGGTYHYLRTVFAGSTWGRLLPFLFVWQFLVSGTLEVASGYIATSNFMSSLAPAYAEHMKDLGVPEKVVVGLPASLMVFAIFLTLRQRIRSLGWLSAVLVLGVLAAVGTVIVLGLKNFDASLITFPENAWKLDGKFVMGLGGAMTVAVYDYLGYYNICHLGDEVRQPEKTIPRAILSSIAIVAAIYMTMNISFIGVVPWQEAVKEGTLAHQNIAAAFMQKLYGERAANAFTLLIIWTCLAGLFAMSIGYSRILYAAAKNGDFFAPFAKLHPTRGFPGPALALLSALTAFFCFFPLSVVIDGAVTVRILIQFIGQIFAIHVARKRGMQLPFRMWLYPLPSLLALFGWVFLLATSKKEALLLMAAVYVSGWLVFVLRENVQRRT